MPWRTDQRLQQLLVPEEAGLGAGVQRLGGELGGALLRLRDVHVEGEVQAATAAGAVERVPQQLQIPAIQRHSNVSLLALFTATYRGAGSRKHPAIQAEVRMRKAATMATGLTSANQQAVLAPHQHASEVAHCATSAYWLCVPSTLCSTVLSFSFQTSASRSLATCANQAADQLIWFHVQGTAGRS